MVKKTLEDVKEFCRENGIKCLSIEYINSTTKMRFECKCGEEFYRTWNKLKEGRIKCEKCSGKRRITIQEVKKESLEYGSECYSEEIKSTKKPLKFKCVKCGNSFSRSWESICRNSPKKFLCSDCGYEERGEKRALNIEAIKTEVSKYGVDLLSSSYKNAKEKLDFRCTCGNIFASNWSNIIKSRDSKGFICCPECSHKHRVELQSDTLEEVKSKCKKINVELLSTHYSSHKDRLLFKCSCGRTFERAVCKVLQGQTRCEYCSHKKSYPEQEIEDVLIKNHVDFKTQYIFKDCKNVSYLRFDFAIFKNNSLVFLLEYDGEQHFYPVTKYEKAQERLEETKYNDNIKNKYCKDNNINLKRIDYTKKKKLEQVVIDILKEFNLYDNTEVNK